MNVTTEFLTNIRRIIRLYNRMLEPICDKYGMSSVEATVISFLYNNPDGTFVFVFQDGN